MEWIRSRFGHHRTRSKRRREDYVGRPWLPRTLAECYRFDGSTRHQKNLLRSLARFNRQSVEMTKRHDKQLSVFLRCVSIGCIIALALLAWLPGTIVTRTILGGHAEHFIAYMGTSILMGLAFQKGPRPTTQFLLIMYAGVLEAGQLYSPGRHASLQDFAFSAAGVVIGGLFLSIARSRMLSWLRRD